MNASQDNQKKQLQDAIDTVIINTVEEVQKKSAYIITDGMNLAMLVPVLNGFSKDYSLKKIVTENRMMHPPESKIVDHFNKKKQAPQMVTFYYALMERK